MVYLISKCSKTVEAKTRNWLEINNFYKVTGLSPDRVYFCSKRSEKAPIADSLGITHFIDDRLEVLSYMINVPHKYLFNPQKKEMEEFKRFLPLVNIVYKWKDLPATLFAKCQSI